MDKKTFIGLCLSLAACALLFQNCGDFTGHSGAEDSSQSSNTNSTDSANETFKAGDPFDIALIPYEITDEYFQSRIDTYPGRKALKALAIAANGKGVAMSSKNADDQADINQAALESCQLAAEGFPCVLLAEGDKFKYDSSKVAENLAFHIRDTTTFDPMKIPGYVNKWKRSHSMSGEDWGYARRTQPFKALAMGINSNVGQSTSLVSQAEANRRAIESCEKRKYTPSCILYAQGNEVVFNSNNFKFPKQKTISFAPSKLDPMKVPFVRDEGRATHILDAYNKMVDDGKAVVIAISIYGHYWAQVGNNANQAMIDLAKANCDGTLPAQAQYSCFVYSVNDNIVMTQKTLDDSYP